MYSKLKFTIKPKLYINEEEQDEIDEITLKTNKYVDDKLLQKIIDDMLSTKFKKHLYTCIFDTGSNDIDDVSQYLDGKILSIKYNKSEKKFTVITSLFLRKQLPKNYSSLSIDELYEPGKVNKLVTKSKIEKMVKENINHVYSSSGHFEQYKNGKVAIYVNLDNSNKQFVCNFKIDK